MGAGRQADRGAGIVASLIEADEAGAAGLVVEARAGERALGLLAEGDGIAAHPAAHALGAHEAPAGVAAVDSDADLARDVADDVVGGAGTLEHGQRPDRPGWRAGFDGQCRDGGKDEGKNEGGEAHGGAPLILGRP
jgi:hypothetical protein